MIKTLRPYQQQVVDNLKQRLKETKHPLLVNMSVGAGKSLVIASILEWIASKNYRALCLTLNSTLIQQNHNTYKTQGMDAGIYCSGLNAKDVSQHIIFGSPQSVCKAIKDKGALSHQRFNMIVVDECHNIDPHNKDTMYQRIINHYGYLAQLENYSFRVIGLTGTPYRNKAESIVGEHAFFKEEVCNISSSWLIKKGYLVKPTFGICRQEGYDFSKLKTNNMGKFNQKELQAVIDKKERLTGEIMRELETIKCNGIFIFAATRKHCEECARSLPVGSWAIITGETPHHERKQILRQASIGNLRYLISVNCLGVGVDIPVFDTCAWLRPTESLVLYTQGIGRILRLHPGKTVCTVLDYAGNLDRHGHIDDPIINQALAPKIEDDPDYCINCFTCNTLNKVMARRCRGTENNKRCEHYFEWKDCLKCGVTNDITSRACRGCGAELIDPNQKLTKIKAEQFELKVLEAKYWISSSGNSIIVNAQYETNDGLVFECHYLKSEKARNIFYAKFIRQHLKNASYWYMEMHLIERMTAMLNHPSLMTPNQLICSKNEYGRYQIIKKSFNTVE